VKAPFPEGAISRTVDVDGPVHLCDMGGPADAPRIVALHGLGGSHLNWSAVGPLLTGRARVTAVDLVGHGMTPAGSRSADMEGHRRLVAGVIDSLGAPVILMGNSMGGLVAALQAAEDPESVAGLILIDPALPTTRLGLVHPRVIANFLLCAVPGVGERYLTERRRRTSAEQTVRRVLEVVCADASRVPADVVEAHIRLTEGLDRALGDAAYLSSARSLSLLMALPASTGRRLEAITQPTLLLHGERDVLVPLSAARQMARAHPAWTVEIAADTGHAPMLEAPEWTARAIGAWLDGDGAPAARAARASTTDAPGPSLTLGSRSTSS
jgi:pimeloyl-ACP methyl ester carboxylesterase